MSRLLGISVQGRRLAASTVIVGAIVFGPMVVDAALDKQEEHSPPEVEADLSFQMVGGDWESALANVESKLDAMSASAPEDFREEIGVPPNAHDLRVSGDGSVVGYALDGEASAASQLIESNMKTKGWSMVELGGIEGATYLKETGRFRWALVTATQIGDTTSIVVRCR